VFPSLNVLKKIPVTLHVAYSRVNTLKMLNHALQNWFCNFCYEAGHKTVMFRRKLFLLKILMNMEKTSRSLPQLDKNQHSSIG